MVVSRSRSRGRGKGKVVPVLN